VNLERALTLSKPLGGHLVRGVVEATGTLESLTPEGDAIIARYNAPPEVLRFVVVKGPVCIDGASLTVIDRANDAFSVSLVEYTQKHTNLLKRRPGDRVNLETDIIARYVERLLEERGPAG
jgi:riboflavin synthase